MVINKHAYHFGGLSSHLLLDLSNPYFFMLHFCTLHVYVLQVLFLHAFFFPCFHILLSLSPDLSSPLGFSSHPFHPPFLLLSFHHILLFNTSSPLSTHSLTTFSSSPLLSSSHPLSSLFFYLPSLTLSLILSSSLSSSLLSPPLAPLTPLSSSLLSHPFFSLILSSLLSLPLFSLILSSLILSHLLFSLIISSLILSSLILSSHPLCSPPLSSSLPRSCQVFLSLIAWTSNCVSHSLCQGAFQYLIKSAFT